MNKRWIDIFLCTLFIFSLILANTTPAYAMIRGSGSYVQVTQASQVVDSITVNGVTVNALYLPGYTFEQLADDPVFSCAAFVSRFYKSVYGFGVHNLHTGSTPVTDHTNTHFAQTTAPRVGDIVRDNQLLHWGIVKSVNQDHTVTLIHQNYSYQSSGATMAQVGGKVAIGDSRYTFFSYYGASKPASPTNLTAAPGENTISLSWSAGDSLPTTYAVLCKANEESNFTEIATTQTPSFTHENIANGVVMEYKIIAFNGGDGSRIYSDSATQPAVAIARIELPKPPSFLVANATDGQAVLNWSAVPQADGYRVYIYSEAQKSYHILADTTLTTYTHTGLLNGETYRYRVRAYRRVDEVNYVSLECSPTAAATPCVKLPEAVSCFEAKVDANNILLSWSSTGQSNQPDTGFLLYRFDIATNQYVLVCQLDHGATTYLDKELTPNSQYSYKLVRYREGEVKNESFPAFASACTTSQTPALPTNIKATRTLGTLSISWDNGENTAGCEIYKFDQSSDSWSYLGETHSQSFALLSADAETVFEIRPFSLQGTTRSYNTNHKYFKK